MGGGEAIASVGFPGLKSRLRASGHEVRLRGLSSCPADRLSAQAPPLAHPNPRRRVSWRVSALGRDFNPGKPIPAFPPLLLLTPFLAPIPPAVVLAARGHFDG